MKGIKSGNTPDKKREYLGICIISERAYLGLPFFYRINNREMNAYMRLYLPVLKTLPGAKNLTKIAQEIRKMREL